MRAQLKYAYTPGALNIIDINIFLTAQTYMYINIILSTHYLEKIGTFGP